MEQHYEDWLEHNTEIAIERFHYAQFGVVTGPCDLCKEPAPVLGVNTSGSGRQPLFLCQRCITKLFQEAR